MRAMKERDLIPNPPGTLNWYFLNPQLGGRGVKKGGGRKDKVL